MKSILPLMMALVCVLAGAASAAEGSWVRDDHFTFLNVGSCARLYRCVAPEQVRAGARHVTATRSKMQAGFCYHGVDSADYCGTCQTDEPRERCTYDLK